MAEDKTDRKKKSQKRIDRQARKAERRSLKNKLLKHEQNEKKNKPVKIRHSKKSLPGFLAKNSNAILTWLRNYQTLFIMADDYGIQKLDRLPQEKRSLLVQNYVDVGDFISILENLIEENKTKKIDKPNSEKELDELVDMSDEDVDKINGEEYLQNEGDETVEEQYDPPDFSKIEEYVNSLTEDCPVTVNKKYAD